MDDIIGTAASSEAAHDGDIHVSPSIGFAPGALPEAVSPLTGGSLQSGVSTRNAPVASYAGCPDIDEVVVRWHALRAAYGKEREACEYINGNGGKAYCPCIKNVRLVKGRRRVVDEAYVPNLLFAYGSIEDLKRFVYDNARLPYLRFYLGFREVCGVMQRRPLFVPDRQMRHLVKICEAEAGGCFVPDGKVGVFRVGDLVRVKRGSKFEGVEGRVARYKGQQCVAVIVDGLLTAATAYIPTFLLERV